MKLAALLSLFPVLALAEPRIETIDRGDTVEVIAHDVTASTTTLVPVRSRLEIPVANKPAPINVPSADPTIVVSELDGKTLSVKTAFDRDAVKNLAAHAKAIQVGPDLHVLIPRKLPAVGATIVLPEPTLANVPKVVEVELPKPEPVKPQEAAPATTATQVAVPAARATEPAPTTPEPPRAARTLPTKSEDPNPLSKAGMLGMMALVAIGCGMWLVRKKRAQQGPQSSIEVLAQHSLGAKAKVVWIAAGDREMVLSVTPQGVRMLGTWERSQSAAAENQFATYTENGKRTRLPTAQVADTGSMPIPIRAARPVKDRAQTVDPSSPAVAGLLKLRAQTIRPPSHDEALAVGEDVATDDPEADALWAKEILLATRASGSGRIARGAR